MAVANTPGAQRSFVLTGTVAAKAPITAAGAAPAAAAAAHGFTDYGGVSGDVVNVILSGTARATAGAAIAAGAAVEVHTTTSQVVTRSAGVIIGRALTAASAAGDEVEILITTI